MADPFLLPRRSIISFSGGRTSGYMLWRVLQAYGGTLPEDVVVVWNNTGLEHEKTYDFVEECSQCWGIRIHWLEYRWEPGRHYFVEVNHATASRRGEPFRMVIEARNFLPNPVMRFCTAELKIRTTNRFVREFLKWEKYFNAIGLRADEPKRVAKMLSKRTTTVEQTLFGEETHVDRGASHPSGETPLCPLAEAGVNNQDVLSFWSASPFDLQLPADERTGRTLAGNCTLCFLKSSKTLMRLIEADPAAADWWVETEELIKGRAQSESGDRFRSDRMPYKDLRRVALGLIDSPMLTEADYQGLACGETAECNCTD